MLFLILFVCAVVFIIGVSEIIHNLALSLFKTKYINNNTLLCYLDDNCAELNLRYVIEQKNWHGRSFAGKIIAISDIKSVKIFNECKKLADSYDINMLTPDEFYCFIKSEI